MFFCRGSRLRLLGAVLLVPRVLSLRFCSWRLAPCAGFGGPLCRPFLGWFGVALGAWLSPVCPSASRPAVFARCLAALVGSRLSAALVGCSVRSGPAVVLGRGPGASPPPPPPPGGASATLPRGVSAFASARCVVFGHDLRPGHRLAQVPSGDRLPACFVEKQAARRALPHALARRMPAASSAAAAAAAALAAAGLRCRLLPGSGAPQGLRTPAKGPGWARPSAGPGWLLGYFTRSWTPIHSP